MKNKLIFLFVVLGLLVGLIFLIYNNRTAKEKLQIEADRISARNQFVQDSIRRVEENRVDQRNFVQDSIRRIEIKAENSLLAQKNIEALNNATRMKQQREIEEYKSFINSSIQNSTQNIDISVTIVDESRNISSQISSDIAKVYNRTGQKGKIGLLTNSFVKNAKYQELFDGNADIIRKLELENHTDYLALGTIRYSTSNGTLVSGTIICTATISINIISISEKTLVKSFTFSVNGNGVTESQAKGKAVEKLTNMYYSEYSSI